MAFKELSQKQILALNENERADYYKSMIAHYKEVKQKAEKQIRETQKKERERNKKKIDHATFLLFGELIKNQAVKNCIAELARNNSFRETEKADINLLLESRKIETRF